MRLEIIIDDDQPLFFQFNKKLVIGSDTNCDIVIEHPEVSKKHVSVYPEDDRFFIIDQGSRNGTFLNDERLIPGKKIEFTSFFPVRLGTSILISLISDEDVSENSSPKIDIPIPLSQSRKPSAGKANEATTIISLKDLQSAKTENLVKKKTLDQKKREKKEPPKKKSKKKSFGAPQIAAFLILAGAYGVHHWSKTEEVTPIEGAPATQTAASGEDRTKIVAEEAAIIPTGGDILTSLLSQGKGCISEAEKALCANLKDLHFLRFTDKGADILVEFAPYVEKARAVLQEFDKKSGKTVEYDLESKEIAQVATAIYYTENMLRFPQLENQDAIITLGFVYKIGEIQSMAAVAAFKASLMPSLAVILNSHRIEAIKTNGISVLDFGRFYQVWQRDRIKWNGAGTSEPVPSAKPESSETQTVTPTPDSTVNGENPPPVLAPTTTSPGPSTPAPGATAPPENKGILNQAAPPKIGNPP